MSLSPIERMIDAAVHCTRCGVQGVGNCHCWDRTTKEEKTDIAEAVRDTVRTHIRTMYPEVWQAMKPSARTSIFNCIENAVHLALARLDP